MKTSWANMNSRRRYLCCKIYEVKMLILKFLEMCFHIFIVFQLEVISTGFPPKLITYRPCEEYMVFLSNV